MRVLFVSPAAELGGAERCLLDCVAELRGTNAQTSKARVAVIALADGPLLEQLRALGANTQIVEPPRELSELGESGSAGLDLRSLLRLSIASPKAALFLARLRAAIVRERPDVVHTNGMKAHLLGGLVAPSRARLAVHLHDFIGSRRASSSLLPALSKIRPHAVFIANSRAVADDFRRIAPRADVRVVYNVVDTSYFSPGLAEPDWLARSANLEPPPGDTITFGLVATYARWKGHELFIRAAGRLRAMHPHAPLRFYIVGAPIYRTLGSQFQASELLDRAREAGIASCFGLVPFQADVPRVYRSLDVVVHASIQPEPFGRTIIEGMACGRAVLVARGGGAAELFDEGENAFGYEPGNIEELARLMTLALDGGTRSRLAQSARTHVVTHFGRSRLGPQLLQAYSKEVGF